MDRDLDRSINVPGPQKSKKPEKTGKNRSRPVLDIPGLKAIYIGYNYLFLIFATSRLKYEPKIKQIG